MCAGGPPSYAAAMTVHPPTTALGQPAADRLAAGFHRCFSGLEADDGLVAGEAFFDLHPPLGGFQIQGTGSAFAAQLRPIAHGPVEVAIMRTIPTATGFARRIRLCAVHDGRVTAVTTCCNGARDAELRARHSAEAPIISP